MNLPTVLETLPAWLGLGAGGGVGFFTIKWFFEWLGGRVDKREARVDAGMGSLIKHLQDEIEKQAEQMGRMLKRIETVERELDECRTKHAEAQAEVMKLRAIVQGYGDAKQQAAAIVAAERVMDRHVAAIVDRTSEKGNE